MTVSTTIGTRRAARPGRSVMTALRRRGGHLLAVLLLVSLGSFLMLDLLPGDPSYAILGDTATPEQVAALHHELNLDRALPVRYGMWLEDLVRGDLGHSYRTGQSTFDAVTERIPTTLELIIVSQLLALVLAVPAAIYAAYRRGRVFDRLAAGAAFGLISAPPFVLAVAFIFLFAVKFRLLPATGWTPLSDSLTGNARSVVLPAFALALSGPLPTYFRLLRSDMIDTLQQDYISMAKAKGLSDQYILARHALRPSSVSLVTLTGVQIGRMLGGTVVIETLFALPGLGRLITTSLAARDLIVLQGAVLFIAVACVLINTTVDLVYPILDPRVHHVGR
jgi:peptide/nickel transport system permease protein